LAYFAILLAYFADYFGRVVFIFVSE